LALAAKIKEAKAAADSDQPARARSMKEGVLRSQWTSWDSELLQMLPAEVQQQFPVVLNSGTAIHKPLFEDLCREVAAGRRSFEEWVRSHLQHQYNLYYHSLEQWLYYKLRCVSQLQHPRLRSSAVDQGAAPTAAAAAAGPTPDQDSGPRTHDPGQQGPAPPAAAAAAAPVSAGTATKPGAPGRGRPASKPAAKASKGAAGQGSKATQTDLRRFAVPKPTAPNILGSSAGSADKSRQPGIAAAAAGEVQGSSAAAAAAAAPEPAPSSSNAAAAATTGAGDTTGSNTAAAAAAAASANGPSPAAAAAGRPKRKAAAMLVANAAFGEFEDEEGWAGYVPSAASVIGLFIPESEPAVVAACFKQLQVGGELWKGDHSYKFVRCVRKDGQMVYGAVFTLMNVSCGVHGASGGREALMAWATVTCSCTQSQHSLASTQLCSCNLGLHMGTLR